VGSVHEVNSSYWVRSTPIGQFAPLDGDAASDVIVVGAGIAGLTAAALAAGDGARVAVVDAGDVCAGATGYTTAKVTALHGLIYGELRSRHGEARARVYADANTRAIAQVERLASSFAPDCEWRRGPAFTYTTSRDAVASVRAEVEAAEAAGLAATFTTESDLPFPIAGAVRLDDQAHFHPRRYCLGLAAEVSRAGGVHPHTRVRTINDSDEGVEVVTDRGTIRAGWVVIATHLPFGTTGGFFARAESTRSYAMALQVDGLVPQGMYLSADSPTRSVRPAGQEGVVIVGGEGHKTGAETDTQARYAALERWARETFRVKDVVARWSAQDYQSVDGLPYIGRVPGRSERVLVATAFRKWGMTNGTVAGMILTDVIAGRDNPWADTFDSTRLEPLASARDAVRINVDAARHLVGDRVRSFRAPSIDDLPTGQGAIVDSDDDKVAAYRHQDGRVVAVSAICTHLGCHVAFNGAERTWDCPCHGSRFTIDGEVLEGPALDDLASFDPA
jgi:glycine/D-amino acid oxidase-like deaminating enzyme/nitrite reductase/ring-hydroxylating ferredoxin subunit